jgi:hypothetical protein
MQNLCFFFRCKKIIWGRRSYLSCRFDRVTYCGLTISGLHKCESERYLSILWDWVPVKKTENKDLRSKIRKILLIATINLVSMYFGPMTLPSPLSTTMDHDTIDTMTVYRGDGKHPLRQAIP